MEVGVGEIADGDCGGFFWVGVGFGRGLMGGDGGGRGGHGGGIVL